MQGFESKTVADLGPRYQTPQEAEAYRLGNRDLGSYGKAPGLTATVTARSKAIEVLNLAGVIKEMLYLSTCDKTVPIDPAVDTLDETIRILSDTISLLNAIKTAVEKI